MDKLHRRLIDLSYFESKVPLFSSNEERDEYHRALGRMVMYGLLRDHPEDTVQLVGLHLEPKEITGAYHTSIPAYDKDKHDQRVRSAVEPLMGPRPFVMGAVKDSEGKFGFHS